MRDNYECIWRLYIPFFAMMIDDDLMAWSCCTSGAMKVHRKFTDPTTLVGDRENVMPPDSDPCSDLGE